MTIKVRFQRMIPTPNGGILPVSGMWKEITMHSQQIVALQRCDEMHRLLQTEVVVIIITSRFNYCTGC